MSQIKQKYDRGKFIIEVSQNWILRTKINLTIEILCGFIRVSFKYTNINFIFKGIAYITLKASNIWKENFNDMFNVCNRSHWKKWIDWFSKTRMDTSKFQEHIFSKVKIIMLNESCIRHHKGRTRVDQGSLNDKLYMPLD